MNILMLSAEFAPYSKTGGLGDAVPGLTQALVAAGHEVRVVTPRYAGRYPDCEPVHQFQTPLPGYEVAVNIHCLDNLVLVQADAFETEHIYYGDNTDAHRFAVMCSAGLRYCQEVGFRPDILHCNDWHSTLAIDYLHHLFSWDKLFDNTRTALSIHNGGYQGWCHENWQQLVVHPDLARDHINLLRYGIACADTVTTVSPTYAKELSQIFLADLQGKKITGIVNGVDPTIWSPQLDVNLATNYTTSDWTEGRQHNRQVLMEAAGLKDKQQPLFGLVSRFTHQKGIDLLIACLPHFLQTSNAAFIALGNGDADLEENLLHIEQAYPDQVHFHRGYDETLAHRLMAGCDFLVMPSRFEPCGLTQLYAMGYGTIPIVRKTGGLNDTVRCESTQNGQGTGFVFEHFDESGLLWGLKQASQLFSQKSHLHEVIERCMGENFSWQRQAAIYTEEYTRVNPSAVSKVSIPLTARQQPDAHTPEAEALDKLVQVSAA